MSKKGVGGGVAYLCHIRIYGLWAAVAAHCVINSLCGGEYISGM